MINILKEKLNKAKLTGWQIRETRKKSNQSFLAKENKESVRHAETLTAKVTVYEKRSETALGNSSFTVNTNNLNDIDALISNARFAASLVTNEPFELPGNPESVPAVQLADNALNEHTLDELEERLRKAVTRDARLSTTEFFIDHSTTRLLNHKGLDLEQIETLIHTEFILLSKQNESEKEFITRYSRRFLSEFNLEHEVKFAIQKAKEATEATLPKTGRFPVIFTGEPLDGLFNPFIARTSARMAYNKMLPVKLGNDVCEGGKVAGDRITLWMNNKIDKAVGSFVFDSYGTPSQKLCLIENNIVKNLLSDKRHADYLKVIPSGELGNIEVESGKTPYADLQDLALSYNETAYHIDAFSAFEPNGITGAFSAEIRSGYEISKNGIKPIKGGSVSGVLQKDMLDVRLSSERETRQSCLVPKGILFKALSIAGE